MIDIKKALLHGKLILQNHSPSVQVDTEILLSYVLCKSRSFLYSHSDSLLTQNQFEIYQQLLEKRILGHPIAYIIGIREFWSLPLRVSEDTLIPRPETELLVELTLEYLSDESTASILDLGTGSGAIALALASERPEWDILGADISAKALSIAFQNASNLQLQNIDFCCSNWFANIPDKKFDAIVANPPYISSRCPHLLEGDVRYEPQDALVSGEDGLDALKLIIMEGYSYLASKGFLLVEHGYMQSVSVQAIFAQSGYQKIRSWNDLQGYGRVTGGWKFKQNKL